NITKELAEAAESANELDNKMAHLHKEILKIKQTDDSIHTLDGLTEFDFPINFLELLTKSND
ncbi:hypothetical protein J4G37_54210, partial [Microvirga sp. 3-52]|nr:hypothetical protein [Microvirga sp. 3-52]